MSSFPEMEWNGKWDWENLQLTETMFGSKITESPKKLQLTDWGLEDEGEIDVGSFNLSGGGSASGRSASDLGNRSSAKSSISASSDSSPEDGIKTTSFGFEALKGSFFGDFSMKTEQGGGEFFGTSPNPEASVGSAEPLIGLKLGKRTYFENSCSGGNAKSPSSVIPVPSTTATKKSKPPSPCAPIPHCQVVGCNVDLSSAKEYHQKHRVCDTHSKCPKVIVGGLERRFCQQCSRFHSLSEFDEKKRSCRKRLSDHNARRRKPQQETIQFNCSRLPSFYDGRQEMNFMVNSGPLFNTRNAAYSDWESTRGSKFTITSAVPLKTGKAGGMPVQPEVTGNQPSHIISMHSNTSRRSLELKSATSPVFTQGLKDSVFSSTLDAAPEFRRALSLLSTSSWGLFEPGSISLDNPVHVSRFNMPQTVMHGIPQGLPLASPEYFPNGQQATYPRVHVLSTNSDGSEHFEGIQVFKTCYETDLCHSSLN